MHHIVHNTVVGPLSWILFDCISMRYDSYWVFSLTLYGFYAVVYCLWSREYVKCSTFDIEYFVVGIKCGPTVSFNIFHQQNPVRYTALWEVLFPICIKCITYNKQFQKKLICIEVVELMCACAMFYSAYNASQFVEFRQSSEIIFRNKVQHLKILIQLVKAVFQEFLFLFSMTRYIFGFFYRWMHSTNHTSFQL